MATLIILSLAAYTFVIGYMLYFAYKIGAIHQARNQDEVERLKDDLPRGMTVSEIIERAKAITHTPETGAWIPTDEDEVKQEQDEEQRGEEAAAKDHMKKFGYTK